jgi:hypothetical protein
MSETLTQLRERRRELLAQKDRVDRQIELLEIIAGRRAPRRPRRDRRRAAQ